MTTTNATALASAVPSPTEPAEVLSPDEPPLRVMSLHALLYCERLFYLEEVEEIRVADHAVYAGRRLHDDVVGEDDVTPERRAMELSSERWGLFGKVDAARRRDGAWVVYEHKKGRCRRSDDDRPEAWPSDRIQAVAYAVLLKETLGEPVPEARVRYHADNLTAFVAIDEDARNDLRRTIDRARELRRTTQRPPVTNNEKLCVRCSLAPVCLPEEERLGEEPQHDAAAPTLFPSDRQRQTLHVVAPKAYISRSGETLVVTTEELTQKTPIQDVDSVVIHGFGQMTTQAIHLCASHGAPVHWISAGGTFHRRNNQLVWPSSATDPAIPIAITISSPAGTGAATRPRQDRGTATLPIAGNQRCFRPAAALSG